MGDTLVLGTSVERRESSNLSLVTNWRMGEWLKPADCKSALRTGTGVRIPLLQQNKILCQH
jgi:hypothetical protein